MSDPLNPLGRTTSSPAIRPRPRAGSPAGGVFNVSVSEDLAAPAEVHTTSAIGAVNPMLLHELAADAAECRDRDARRHGHDVLDLLDEVQRGLLRAGVATSAMARLLSLVEDPPEAADPALAAVTRAIVLRARIEIARRLSRAGAQD